MASLDLNLLPLVRRDGQELNSLPGLYMVTPPNKAARGRSTDQLILFFNMAGNAPLTDQQQEQLLGRLAQTFYKTPGSVTAALKTCIDAMNQYLLDRNLRSSSSGKQCIGLMSLLVLRETNMLLAQSGPNHTFLVSQQENQEFFDPQGSGRGLGLTRAVTVRYYQFELHANDLLVLTPQPPPAWNLSTLQMPPGQGLDPLRRRLLSQAGPDLLAAVIQVQPGTGRMRLIRTKPPVQMAQPAASLSEPGVPSAAGTSPTAQPESPPIPEVLPAPVLDAGPATAAVPESSDTVAENQQTPPTALEPPATQDEGTVQPLAGPSAVLENPPEAQMASTPPAEALPEAHQLTPGKDLESVPAVPADTLPPLQPYRPTTSAPQQTSTSQHPVGPRRVREIQPSKNETTGPALTQATPHRRVAGRNARPAARRSPKMPAIPVGKAFARLGQAVGGTLASIARGILGLLKRILPDESLFTIPASTMAFIAVAVALIFASAGGVVYFQRGRAAQYQTYYELALGEAGRAVQQTDPLELRTAWETTLNYLDKADQYQTTPDSSLLRTKANEALDNLDGIVRLDFQPAITTALGGLAEVSRIVANDTDLYLLNAQSGNVLRATLTGRGYEIDPNFSCGPNPQVGKLIDIAPLPKGNSFNATILAMDANGNLLYCIPGSLAVENAPAPPQPGWGSPIAFTLDSGDLYALDPKTNGVWIYRNMVFDHQPHLFFGNQVPRMGDVVGLAVNNDDLFLLHQDGHLTICIYSELQVSDTRCTDPASYTDKRPGRQNGPIILDAQFSQMIYTQPPDPSIYMLDALRQAIYHFSVKLTLQEQFRSKNPLPANANATAFTVTQNRVVFMAVGNQVYYANLP